METQITNKKELLSKLTSRAVLILRGLPGSGKTTFTNDLEDYLNTPDPNALAVVSADHLFVNDNGEYVFNKHLLGQAHAACREDFLFYAQKKGDKRPLYLVVDNTNLTNKESSYYVKTARENQWDVIFITFECSPETSIKRNIHGVPAETITSMVHKMNTFEPPKNCLHYRVKGE